MLSGMTATPVIALANLKGGVGKSTTSTNLAERWAHRLRERGDDRRILLVDADSQGGTTRLTLGYKPDSGADLGTVITEVTPLAEAAIQLDSPGLLEDEARAAWEGIDVVPAPRGRVRVDGLDYDLMRETVSSQIDPTRYAVALVDTGHGDADLTTLGLVSADHVIGVTVPEYLPFEQLDELSTRLRKIGRSFAHVRDLAGIIVGGYDGRTAVHKTVLTTLEQDWGERFLRPVVPQRVVIKRAANAALPVSALPHGEEVAALYDRLVAHLIDHTLNR